MPEPFPDQLARVKLMASGSPTWDLSPNDIAALEAILEDRDATINEIKSVLMLMDGLAEQWGDEGVFRRCRDRLRKLGESNQ